VISGEELKCYICRLMLFKMRQYCALLFLVFLFTADVLAQDTTHASLPALRHEMTPYELQRKGEIGRNFVPTEPPVAPVRNVAEFDRMQGALVRYPFGIPVSLIREMAEDVTVTTIVGNNSQKNAVLSQYVSSGVDTSHCNFLIAATESYWTRDYGPWFESDSSGQIGIVDFPYNRPRPNDDEIPIKIATMLGIPLFGMEVISTGGDYMTDGYGISASTDLVWNENPTLTPEQISGNMFEYLGINNFHVVPDPNISSYIDHIDCWGKFLAPDKILIRKVLTNDPEYSALEDAATYWASQICSYGYKYKVYRVQTPQDQPYTNSVILNDKVLVPFMNSDWDDSAKAVYESAMPGYKVIGFIGNPSTPWISTDALHCRVMGIADIGLLHISHIPITGNQPCEAGYIINTDIIASSRKPVINDSVIVHYQVNGGQYQAIRMLNSLSNHYTGSLPAQPAGSVIKYYITAADGSGRCAASPFMGAADPFTFHTVYTNLAPVPDTLWIRTIEDGRKISQLHNFTENTIWLNDVQKYGTMLTWWVDSMSVAVLPHMLYPGDSVAIRVQMAFPVKLNPAIEYVVDSMRVSTSAGSFHLIVMANKDLLQSINEPEPEATTGNNYPNPFSTLTTIPLEITRRSHVHLEILDIRGTRIKTLASKVFEPGTTLIQWDGTDAHGDKMTEGIYLCRVILENRTATVRMVLIR
jgi:agmatine deiminase